VATLGRRCKKATLRRRAIDVFTPKELQRLVVEPSGLQLVQPLDLKLSPQTWQNVIVWRGSGEFESTTGDPWPHVLLQPEGSLLFLRGGAAPFTSAALALEKPTDSNPAVERIASH
jgi:hypothetical protein